MMMHIHPVTERSLHAPDDEKIMVELSGVNWTLDQLCTIAGKSCGLKSCGYDWIG